MSAASWRDEELRALVDQAFELREGPYLIDAVDAITAWYERRHLRALERRQVQLARLVALLRATDPARIAERRAA